MCMYELVKVMMWPVLVMEWALMRVVSQLSGVRRKFVEPIVAWVVMS